MGYVPGEENIESVENPELISKVYRTLDKLGGPKVSGSTRFKSHGYLTGFETLPDMEALQVMFPDIEFQVHPQQSTAIEKPESIDDQDTFGDITISFRTKGSQGWHNFLQGTPEELPDHDIGFLCWCGITHQE